jgi:hypothetical protein
VLGDRGLGEGQLRGELAAGALAAGMPELAHDGDARRVAERAAQPRHPDRRVESAAGAARLPGPVHAHAAAGSCAGSHAMIRPASADAATV